MGVSGPDISFLLAARELGTSYERMLMIGRQWLLAQSTDLIRAYQDAGKSIDPRIAERLVEEGGQFAEPVFRQLGAREIDSLDLSTFEGATIVHDLNNPLPEHLRNRYSVVFDGGALEHVFNFPQALKNCLQAVEPGGHFITIAPTNGYVGHGFYQFSPELYYQALASDNGFEVIALLVRPRFSRARWRAVAKPAEVGRRVTLSRTSPTLMYVLAKRIAEAEIFAAWPQQSDYMTAWSAGTVAQGGSPVTPSRQARTRILAQLPTRLRGVAQRVRTARVMTARRSGPGDFRPVRMADVARGSLKRG